MPGYTVLKTGFRYTGYLLLGLFAIVVTLLFFALDDTPQAKRLPPLSRDDIQRAKHILSVSQGEQGELKTIRLNQNDINIAASYLLDHFIENAVQIDVGDRQLRFQIELNVPENFWGRYLDIHFKLLQSGEEFWVKSLKVGEISIPGPAANTLMRAALNTPPLDAHWDMVKRYVKRLNIADTGVEISYLNSIVSEARQQAIDKHRDYPNLHRYQAQINDVVARHDPAWRLSISDLLQPLFITAYQIADESTAIRENRTVVIAMASYVYKQALQRFLPIGLVYNKDYPVYAYKRIDIPQHFVISALLAMVDDAVLGEQLGIAKELGDAEQGGSGFSFVDLSADRTGTRFGRLAVASPHQARALQKIMASTNDYRAFIPFALDLPEQMDDASFRNRFGHVGSPAYEDVIKEIDKRIDALPIYGQP
ncbi:MAG: hypothetical protein KGZ80_07885 [Methylomonas sp.]|nr:hypothetical protein [Methylomonas sp.]PPD20860.1 MAG: hypothetical protein CTY23_07195 [Methylomonas sp.]PPD26351.1 MAG: hypothetical protein CTY22_05555 [Methylomonas sp.]PPD38072.1 MAG: hypothetical protein CTY21_05550 [Methylomonas sp.]PPD40291.1 MAG: hypothetical protein CTY17_06685 [Methylomonas sp.]